MIRYYSFMLLLLLTQPLFAQRAQKPAGSSPKLVVTVVVEQMRPDYIDRYIPKFRDKGFSRLITEGVFCENITINQLAQGKTTGMATLYTGTWPSDHGIIDTKWYNRTKGEEVTCLADKYNITVGSDSEEGQLSARHLMVETIGDKMKKQTLGRAKIFSVALNGESAVAAAGHAADGAFWLDTQTGNIISSSYYLDAFPDWVHNFNMKALAKQYMERDWTTLLPASNYEESLADDYILEKGFYGKWNTFPYSLEKLQKEAKSFAPLKVTPYGNSLVKDFALQLIEQEKLGEDDITDLLTIVFSSMDDESSSFGPGSVEMQDTYLRIDQEIEHLLNYLDQHIGKGGYLLCLTSNVSASYAPGYLKEELRYPAGEFSPRSAVALLKSFLNITYGQGEWVIGLSAYQVYLNRRLIEKNNINLHDIQKKAAAFLNEFEGIKTARAAHLLYEGNSLPYFTNAYHFKRSGDILFELEQGWWPVFKYQRTTYTDNTTVPLILFGNGVKPGRIKQPYSIIDIVPTICRFINLPVPEKARGNVIREVYW